MTPARRVRRPGTLLSQDGVAPAPLWQPVHPALVPGEAVPGLPSIAATWENTIVELIVTGLVTTAFGGNPLLTVIVTLHDPTCVMLNTLVVEVLEPDGMLQPVPVVVQEKFNGPGPDALPWRVTPVMVWVGALPGTPLIVKPSAVEVVGLKSAPLGIEPAAGVPAKVTDTFPPDRPATTTLAASGVSSTTIVRCAMSVEGPSLTWS